MRPKWAVGDRHTGVVVEEKQLLYFCIAFYDFEQCGVLENKISSQKIRFVRLQTLVTRVNDTIALGVVAPSNRAGIKSKHQAKPLLPSRWGTRAPVCGECSVSPADYVTVI
jgi:hypothetical protein